jgi:hypothetical protein
MSQCAAIGRRSGTAVPLVALIAPVAAIRRGHEHDTGEILGVLVAELHRSVNARRPAMFRTEEATVLPVGDERLRVHRALQIPALVVVPIEAAEVDVAGVRRRLHEPRELADAHAGPGRARVPALHAEVVDLLRDAREAHQLVEREGEWTPHGSGDLEAPCAARGRIPDRELVRDEILWEVAAGDLRRRGHAIHRVVPEDAALDGLVLPFREVEQRARGARVLVARGEQRTGEARGGDGEKAAVIEHHRPASSCETSIRPREKR